MSVRQVNRDTVLAAIRSGARSLDDIAAHFQVLSHSPTLRQVLDSLLNEGLIYDGPDGLHAHGEQLTIDEEN
ncbi:hypothetical protein ACWT_5873 [Actinoplanes sp. SE50]|uniref:(2Fe-2S)-binding protein n=1 Tax=unclassified Actinoplanes TaxID=2626549 RepID=UPI00023EBDDD|nr:MULTISPECIES: hypothetical protein [unclassified Actinoplanes]AEV86891.1 hypothetical protein ACPL_6004 [Actinoplanes sp. SE50/110]ATO85288.1 hypothetical protein ACWT_5873 [Actinoplanes sp. SE50]SLM02698.1 hypothetical protein ACSP50_5980 [Actinoplanes sp. SE50/110]